MGWCCFGVVGLVCFGLVLFVVSKLLWVFLGCLEVGFIEGWWFWV